ncbi:MAG: MFS transporter [Coriobacteriales bacterium]|nr:MFS transporter [Coriobacteriales bacterium]
MSDKALDKSKCVDGSYAWIVVVVTMLCGFIPGSNMAKAIALAPVVCMTYGFDPAAFGVVVACFYIMGAVMAFPTMGMVNKLGMKGSVGVVLAVSVIGCAMGALAGTNATLFVVSRIFEGAAFGIMGVVGASSIGPWFSKEKRSFPLSIWSMWVAVCMCVCPVMFGYLNENMGVGLQAIWWGTMVYDIIASVLFIVFYRKPADQRAMSEGEEVAESKANLKRALKSPMLWALSLIFLFDEAAFMAINGFITTYLNVELGTTLVFANAIFSLFGLLGAVFPPISGVITQKFRNHRWMLLFGLICAVAYTALVFHIKNPVLFYPLSILAGIVGGCVPSILWQFAPNTVCTDDIPAANSFMAFTQNVGMIIGALVIGNAISMWGWGMGSLIGMVPLYIICLVIFFAFGVHKKLKLENFEGME